MTFIHRMLAAALLLVAASTAASALAAPVPLTPGASDRDIAEHMFAHEAAQTQTTTLGAVFPDMSRERAYRIQQLRMVMREDQFPRRGWKLGWSRVNPDGPLDPIVGHYLDNRVFAPGEPVSTRHFTAGTAMVEPEIVFHLDKDLVGPVVTRSQVIDAIGGVSVGMEFVNWRVAEPRTRAHAIADNGIAAGAVLGGRQVPLDSIDLASEIGFVTVNGKTNRGPATSIFDEDPVAALVWAANELVRRGMYMKAGEFVFSGTVCIPLPVVAGDTATVGFSGLGEFTMDFVR